MTTFRYLDTWVNREGGMVPIFRTVVASRSTPFCQHVEQWTVQAVVEEEKCTSRFQRVRNT